MPNEILGVIGDNGAGKSTLIKVLAGAVIPDAGEILHGRQAGPFPLADRGARTPASRPSTRTSRCRRRCRSPTTCFSAASGGSRDCSGGCFRLLDRAAMRSEARRHLNALGLLTIQNINQPVETLSGGQRQGVAVVRATAFGSRVIIMDEPTAALGVKESRKVLELMLDVKKRGLPIILISHNMPHVFEVADRIHIHRLGRRIAVIDPKKLLDVGRGRDHDRRDEAAAGRGAGDLEKDVIRKNCGWRLLSAATKARRRIVKRSDLLSCGPVRTLQGGRRGEDGTFMAWFGWPKPPSTSEKTQSKGWSWTSPFNPERRAQRRVARENALPEGKAPW